MRSSVGTSRRHGSPPGDSIGRSGSSLAGGNLSPPAACVRFRQSGDDLATVGVTPAGWRRVKRDRAYRTDLEMNVRSAIRVIPTKEKPCRRGATKRQTTRSLVPRDDTGSCHSSVRSEQPSGSRDYYSGAVSLVLAIGAGSVPLRREKRPAMRSMGSGKTTVVFFSAPISVSVCR